MKKLLLILSTAVILTGCANTEALSDHSEQPSSEITSSNTSETEAAATDPQSSEYDDPLYGAIKSTTLTDEEFENICNSVYYNGKPLKFPCTVDDILALDDDITIYDNDKDSTEYMRFYVGDEKICYLSADQQDGNIYSLSEEPNTVCLGVNLDVFSLFGGRIKKGCDLSDVIEVLGDGYNHSDNWPNDYDYIFTYNDMRLDVGGLHFDENNKLTSEYYLTIAICPLETGWEM